MINHPSPNFDARKDGRIKYLILHYTGMATGQEALDRLCDAEAAVSAHYLIEEDGRVFSLVDEEMRAWHAGVSKWEDDVDINDLSVGIEIVNTGHPYPGYESVYKPFTEKQMQALIPLAQSIVKRHEIKACHVVGHSDVAWRRKIDPGELFDWKRLSEEGVGLWPRKQTSTGDEEVNLDIFMNRLSQYGYDTEGWKEDATQLISAFQRHFRPQDFSGKPDAETFFILEDLLKQKAN